MRQIAILDRRTIERWARACDCVTLGCTAYPLSERASADLTAECMDLHRRRLAAGGGAWARPPIWGVVRDFR